MSDVPEGGYTPENPEIGPDDNVVPSPGSQQAIQGAAEEASPDPEAAAAKADDDDDDEGTGKAKARKR